MNQINTDDRKGEPEILTVGANGDAQKPADPLRHAQGDRLVSEHSRAAITCGVPSMTAPLAGRGELLDSVVEELISGQAASLSSAGLAGVGLTALAAAIARHPRVREHFADGVLWASLGQSPFQPDVLAILAQWAGELGVDISNRADISARSAALKEAIGQRRLLLVIDNASELNHARALQCGGPNCGHLLTTHFRTLARDFAGAEHYRLVSPLDHATAYDLLKQLAPDVCAAEPDLSRAVAVAAGGLPLALKLLSGYLSAPAAERVSSGLRIARTPRERLMLAQQRLGSGEHANTILAQAIALSLTGLPAYTLRAFYDLGAFVPAPACFSMKAAVAVTGATAQTIEQLIARNLLERLSRENEPVGTLAAAGEITKLSLHAAIAGVACVRRDPKTVARHRAFYLAYAARHAGEQLAIQDAYDQIMQAWSGAPDDPALLEFVWSMRQYQERIGLQHVINSWSQRCIGMPRLACASSTHNRAMELLDIVNRTLTIADSAMITNGAAVHTNRATVLFNVGNAFDILQRREQALHYYDRTWPVQEELGDREGLAITLNNIGSIYYEMNLPGKALEYLRLSLDTREGCHDSASTQFGQTLNNLGVIYTSLGMAKEAMEHFTRSLRVHQQLHDMAGEALTRANLARFHQLRGPLSDAITHMRRVVELDLLIGSPDITRHQAKLAHLLAELSPSDATGAKAPAPWPAQVPILAPSPTPRDRATSAPKVASAPGAQRAQADSAISDFKPAFAFIRRARRQPVATP